MGFLESLLVRLVNSWVGKIFKAMKGWFVVSEKIKKTNEQIDKEVTGVKEAATIIKNKIKNGEEITDEDVRRLNEASARFTGGFYH